MTIHFVYPFDSNRVASPWSIGNEITKRLIEYTGEEVKNHDWLGQYVIAPSSGDILIGHPHPEPGYVFTNSLYGDWRERIIFCPWRPSNERKYLDWLIDSTDGLVCILGREQYKELPYYWRKKTKRTDMAIIWDNFPNIKQGDYSKKKHRNLLYIGHTLEMKNTDYLTEIADKLSIRYPDVEFGHIGNGMIKGWENYGYCTNLSDAYDIIKKYDFAITPSREECNSTTVLETTSLGLLTFSTPGAGWLSSDSVQIPLNNVDEVCKILKYWQMADKAEIIEAVEKYKKTCSELYTFDKMFDKVAYFLRQ